MRFTTGRSLLIAGALGGLIAPLHALYLGATAPVPGAYRAGSPFVLTYGPGSWVVVPALGRGARQYSLTPDAHRFPQISEDAGAVPSWVLRPLSGQKSISRGFGWPFVTLSGSEVYAANGQLLETPGYHLTPRQQFLPTRICWGLPANTLLFASAAFLCLGLVGHAARRMRLHRARTSGACANCGYDIKGIGPECPECGQHQT